MRLKYIKLTKALTVLLVLIFISCAGGKGEGDKEPNNEIDQANDITLSQPFSLTINPKGDMDWFKVNLAEQGYLKVQASQVPEEINLEIVFALYQEWEGEKEKRLRGWRRLPDALFISEAGTYYFVIKDDHDNASSGKPAQIKVDFLKEFDPTEPNNAPEQAKSVEIGTDLKIAVYPVLDQDWLKVKVEKQGYLIVKSKNVPEGITPEVKYFVFDEWADPKVKTIRDWKRLPDACFVSEVGEYFILAHDNHDNEASETPYDLKIEFLDEMDQYEPNDDFKKAISLGICKINFYTGISQAAVAKVHKFIEEHPGSISYPDLAELAMTEIKNVVKDRMEVFGSKGQCAADKTLCITCSETSCGLDDPRMKPESRTVIYQDLVEKISREVLQNIKK